MEELRVPKWDAESTTWVEDDRYLLVRDLAQFWTEHSPRAVLPTAAQILQMPKEELNCLGRWSPTGGEDYARAHKAVVTKIQQQIAQAVRDCDPRLREADILDRLRSWAELRNFTYEQQERLHSSLSDLARDFWQQMGKSTPPVESEMIKLSDQVLKQVSRTLHVKGSGRQSATFLIVYSRNRKRAKLHRVGGCQWTVVSLADAQEVVKPVPTMYDSRCKLCWPKMLAGRGPEEGSSDESEL